MKKKRKSVIFFLKWIACIVIALVLLFPVLFTILNSFFPEVEIINRYGDLLNMAANGQTVDTSGFSLEQYRTILLNTPDFLFRFWNSVFLVVPVVVLQLGIGCFAAYGFTKLEGKFANVIFFFYILLMMIPYQVTIVPVYMAISDMHLLDTFWSIWLPGFFAPFAVYLMTKYMRRVPKALQEAAQIDGAGNLRIFLGIMMPMCKGQLAACGILVFIDYWNMVEYPLVMFSNAFSYPLSIFLSKLSEGEIGIAFAAAVIYMIPVLLVYFYGEEHLEDMNIAGEGVKG